MTALSYDMLYVYMELTVAIYAVLLVAGDGLSFVVILLSILLTAALTASEDWLYQKRDLGI